MLVLLVDDREERTSTLVDISERGLDTTVASLCAGAGVDTDTHGLSPGIPSAVPKWATAAWTMLRDAKDEERKAGDKLNRLRSKMETTGRDLEYLRDRLASVHTANRVFTQGQLAGVKEVQQAAIEEGRGNERVFLWGTHDRTVAFHEKDLKEEMATEDAAREEVERYGMAVGALLTRHGKLKDVINNTRPARHMYRVMSTTTAGARRSGDGVPTTRRRRLDGAGAGGSGEATLRDNGVELHEGCDFVTLWVRPKDTPSSGPRCPQWRIEETLTPHPASEYWGVVPPTNTHRPVDLLLNTGTVVTKFREYIKMDDMVKTMQSPGWERVAWLVENRAPMVPRVEANDIDEAGGRLLTPADVAAIPGGGKTKDAIVEVMERAPFGDDTEWGKNNHVVEIAGSAATWLAIGVETGTFPADWTPGDIDLFIEGHPESRRRDTDAIIAVASSFPPTENDDEGMSKTGRHFISEHAYAVVGLEATGDTTVQIIDPRCQRVALTSSFDLSPCRVRLTYQGRGTPEEGWKLFIDTDRDDLLAGRMTVYASPYFRGDWTRGRIAKYIKRGWKTVTLAPGIVYPSWRVKSYHQSDAPRSSEHELLFDVNRARAVWQEAVASVMRGLKEGHDK